MNSKWYCMSNPVFTLLHCILYITYSTNSFVSVLAVKMFWLLSLALFGATILHVYPNHSHHDAFVVNGKARTSVSHMIHWCLCDHGWVHLHTIDKWLNVGTHSVIGKVLTWCTQTSESNSSIKHVWFKQVTLEYTFRISDIQFTCH